MYDAAIVMYIACAKVLRKKLAAKVSAFADHPKLTY